MKMISFLLLSSIAFTNTFNNASASDALNNNNIFNGDENLKKELNIPQFTKAQDVNVYVMDTGCNVEVFNTEHKEKIKCGFGVNADHTKVEKLTKSKLGRGSKVDFDNKRGSKIDLGHTRLLESKILGVDGNDTRRSHGTHVTGIVAQVAQYANIVPIHIGGDIAKNKELYILYRDILLAGKIVQYILSLPKNPKSFFDELDVNKIKINKYEFLFGKSLGYEKICELGKEKVLENFKTKDPNFDAKQLIMSTLVNLIKSFKDLDIFEYARDFANENGRKIDIDCSYITKELLNNNDVKAKNSIINMSFGQYNDIGDETLENWCNLIEKGYTLVVSLGNDGIEKEDNSSNFYKKAINFINDIKSKNMDYEKQIIFVGGYKNKDGKKTTALDTAGGELANYTIYAPSEIDSYVPFEVSKDGHEIEEGTSMAAPVVSGMLANLISCGLTAHQARDILFNTTKMEKVETTNNKKVTAEKTLNIINAERAIKIAEWKKEINKGKEELNLYEKRCENPTSPFRNFADEFALENEKFSNKVKFAAKKVGTSLKNTTKGIYRKFFG